MFFVSNEKYETLSINVCLPGRIGLWMTFAWNSLEFSRPKWWRILSVPSAMKGRRQGIKCSGSCSWSLTRSRCKTSSRDEKGSDVDKRDSCAPFLDLASSAKTNKQAMVSLQRMAGNSLFWKNIYVNPVILGAHFLG